MGLKVQSLDKQQKYHVTWDLGSNSNSGPDTDLLSKNL